MLFEAFLAWYLASMTKRQSTDVKALGWAFFAWQLPGLVFSWLYFGIAPFVFSVAVALLIAAATWLARPNKPQLV
jgi:hypothetical protein